MANIIYGRQPTKAGKTLGEIFKSDTDLFSQYMKSIEAIDPEIDSDIDYKELAKHTLDRLSNEDILIYLADSLRGSPRYGITGTYKRGSFGTPDTSFVAKYDYGSERPARQMVNTSLHEALLHGSGLKHESKINPLFGRLGSALLDYLFPGKYIPTDKQVRKSGQLAYKFEEADLEDVMREEQVYLPYAESLLGEDRYSKEVEAAQKLKDRRSQLPLPILAPPVRDR